jgi:hypothetical protein
MENEHRLLAVSSETCRDWWPIVKRVLAPTFARSEVCESMEDLADALARKDAQLWVELNAGGDVTGAVVTRLIRFPKGLHVQVMYAAGRFHSGWGNWLDIIETWGKNQGCIAIEVLGRKGWERIFISHGYAHAYSVIRKAIDNKE